MSGLAWISMLVMTFGQGQSAQGPDRAPVRLKIGDSIVVSAPVGAYGGSFTILDDGSVYGRFGRLVLEGKTVPEAEKAVRDGLAKFVKPDLVFVNVASLRSDVIYINNKGPVALQPSQNLRQILASLNSDDADRQDLSVLRDGKKILAQRLSKVLEEGSSEGTFLPQANDIINIVPIPTVRFWLMGRAAKPGEYRVNDGLDIYQALAQAGGLADVEAADPALKLLVRRGPDTFELSVRPDPTKTGPKIENGDLITVMGTNLMRYTIAGEVANPGDVTTRGNKPIFEAITLAGGVTQAATLKKVIVYRKGEILQIDADDALNGTKLPNFEIENGDLVIVRKNERTFFMFGEIGRPGKYMMDDRKRYFATDILALGGGLSGKGTLRRIRIGRPGPTGALAVTTFNLDEYIKGGKPEANPEILPGDVVLFGEPRGITLGSAVQLLGSFLLVDNLAKK